MSEREQLNAMSKGENAKTDGALRDDELECASGGAKKVTMEDILVTSVRSFSIDIGTTERLEVNGRK